MMSIEPSAVRTPIVCDMTDAPDTEEERIAEWARLLAVAYAGRERTDGGVRLRLRADDGIEAWVRDLAARDKACCPFLDFTVSTGSGEVRWDVTLAEGTVIDDDMTRTIMDEFYNLPDTAGAAECPADSALAGHSSLLDPGWPAAAVSAQARASWPYRPRQLRRPPR